MPKRTKAPVCKKGTPCGFACLGLKADGKPKACKQKADTSASSKLDSLLDGIFGSINAEQATKEELEKEAKIVKSGLSKQISQWKPEKLEAIKAEVANDAEAYALYAYLSHAYSAINMAMYAPDKYNEILVPFDDDVGTIDDARVIHKYLNSAIDKLPAITGANSFAEQKANDKPEKQDKYAKYYEGAPFVHAMQAVPGLFDSLKELKPGQEYSFNKFLSTGYELGGTAAFARKDTHFVIEGKTDGTGKGKLVDKFKGEYVEQEVLYPSTAKFQVQYVEFVPPAINYLVESFLYESESDEESLEKLKDDQLKPYKFIQDAIAFIEKNPDAMGDVLYGLSLASPLARVYLKEL